MLLFTRYSLGAIHIMYDWIWPKIMNIRGTSVEIRLPGSPKLLRVVENIQKNCVRLSKWNNELWGREKDDLHFPLLRCSFISDTHAKNEKNSNKGLNLILILYQKYFNFLVLLGSPCQKQDIWTSIVFNPQIGVWDFSRKINYLNCFLNMFV